MSATHGYDARTVKSKKPSNIPPAFVNPGHSGPTTFFLKSERDIERSAQRGRRASRSVMSEQEDHSSRQPSTSAMADSRFGVQSLEDTINSAFASDDTLSRTNSNVTESSVDAGAEANAVIGRKRKAGNPVHPKIAATAQRIISAEQAPTQASSAASPSSLRSSESPFRTHLRRGSASSINLNSQPLTPLKMSPQPESAMPSTPRSGSPKSFRLSDEEGSIADETGSQAIQSSSGEEDEGLVAEEVKDGSMPQLVMPSIAMPARRPFTERGKRIGRMKVMVVGPNGIGKTSLIQSILRTCEDVVHVDPASNANHSPACGAHGNDIFPTIEVHASTRPYPSWWTDFESRRMLLRRKSVGDGVLERNLCFLDTPGINDEQEIRQISHYVENLMRRTATMERMSDGELASLLSGDGGIQIDAVLWLIDAENAEDLAKSDSQTQLLQMLCKCTNVVPLIGRGDLVEAERLLDCKHSALDVFKAVNAEPYLFNKAAEAESDLIDEPYLISSALSDDAETMDASVLMSSQYVQPLMPSQLGDFVERFFDPDNVARMRHLSAIKFLLWRQEHLGMHIDLQKQALLKSPQFGHTLPSVTSTGSMLEEPSKVLVPHGASSYFRSASPSAVSEASAPPSDHNAVATSAYALARYNEQITGAEPFRQVRLAKWAQDLQRSLHNERKRYKQMYAKPPSDWASSTDDAEKSEQAHQALVPAREVARRPARGCLGGDVSVFDPRDPLGVLALSQAFRRRGWFALQVAGGCGLVGAVAFWVMRNWVEVQEWCGLGPPVVIQAPAVPAPTKGLMGYLEDFNWRGFFGWDRYDGMG